jgi:hypothetical protein
MELRAPEVRVKPGMVTGSMMTPATFGSAKYELSAASRLSFTAAVASSRVACAAICSGVVSAFAAAAASRSASGGASVRKNASPAAISWLVSGPSAFASVPNSVRYRNHGDSKTA